MKYSLIFGACGGLGKGFSTQLVKQNKNLILVGTSTQKLSNLKDELLLLNSGVEIKFFTCNLINEKERESLKEKLDNFVIDELFYIAGIDTRMEFEKFTESKIISQIRVNFEGCVSLVNYVLKRRKTPIKILVVSSICGLMPMPYYSVYSATKSALNYFCFALKKELPKKEVKLTVLAPSSIPTREDIKEDIKKQGLTGKLASKHIDFIVKKGLKALEKNKRICIPGFYNKLVNFVNKITPLGIKMSVVKRKFKGKEKDAFL